LPGRQATFGASLFFLCTAATVVTKNGHNHSLL
jgi:hypothetical protein